MTGHAPIGAVVVLSRAEQIALSDCEQRIEAGMKTFLEVGMALAAIRDNKLYRADHATFEAYCAARWGFTGRRGRQLIDAAEVGRILPVANAGQAAELAKVPEPDRAAVLAEATARGGGKATAEKIREVAKDSAGLVDPAEGTGRSSDAPLPPSHAPSPGEDGEGAPNTLVWVATVRRGITYHRIADHGVGTVCDRSMRYGQEISRMRATNELAGEPCPRCWTAAGDAPAPTAQEAAAATVVSTPAPAPVAAPAGAGVTPDVAPGTETASPAAVPGAADPPAGVGEQYRTDPAERIAAVAEVAPEYVQPAEPAVNAELARRLDIALDQFSNDLGHLAVLLHQAGPHAGGYLHVLRRRYTDLGELLRFLEDTPERTQP